MNIVQKELQYLLAVNGVDLMTEEWQEYMLCALQEIERLEEKNGFLEAELNRLSAGEGTGEEWGDASTPADDAEEGRRILNSRGW